GPSPGAGIVVVVGGVPLVKPMLLAATAKALAVRMALGLFHFRYVNDGVAVHGPSCHFASASPPIAYESVPEVTSLNSSCRGCTLTLLMYLFFKSQKNFSLKPSGFRSGSNVAEVRCHV